MSHGATATEIDRIEAMDYQKWTKFLFPLFWFLCFTSWYFFFDADSNIETQDSKISSIHEAIDTIKISSLDFSNGPVRREIKRLTLVLMNINGYQFDIDGRANIDGCIIENRKVVKGTLPGYKYMYLVTPLKNTLLTFSKITN